MKRIALRIAEHLGCQLQRDAMFAPVGAGFRRIPFKPLVQSHLDIILPLSVVSKLARNAAGLGFNAPQGRA